MRRWVPFLLIVLAVLLLDQLSKQWVLENIALGETYLVIPQLHPYFQFTYSANTGAAFGIFPEAGALFQFLPLVIVVVMLYFVYRSGATDDIMRIGFGLAVGGALGNVIDRLQHGHVIDFFHVYIPQINLSNVSNFADHAIVLGVMILLVDNLWQERKNKTEAQVSPDEVSSGDA
ncbi:signal peptidase II [Phototrophicus methaneseepsis]|uniref:Lipoprotein signal peptidase n=1 Tax=Phototrophicus methaneseepsis TaxID=2710758 RepID=A0A7S8IGQ0_9CHLR|nr:signal peptidase II [Phototrophicus methaneseepsis]QPC84899.1 signal peptidase II [Phototrophicus methaneseepsis]